MRNLIRTCYQWLFWWANREPFREVENRPHSDFSGIKLGITIEWKTMENRFEESSLEKLLKKTTQQCKRELSESPDDLCSQPARN